MIHVCIRALPVVGLAVVSLLVGCPKGSKDAGSTAAPQQAAAPKPKPEPPNIRPLPPPFWLPKAAPEWTRDTAGVVTRGDETFVYAVAFVRQVENESLARSTAANRAKALLSQQLGTERRELPLKFGQVADTWMSQNKKIIAVKVEVPLSANPLPQGATP